MSKFDIDINDMIKFFKEAGFEIVDAKPGEEGGIYIDGKKSRRCRQSFRRSFSNPDKYR